MQQWSRWCRHPECAVGVEGDLMRERYRRVSLPMSSISFADDEYMSERNVAALHGFYERARRDMRRIEPHEVGLRRIGHFGFFRDEAAAQLWPLMLDWVDRSVAADRAKA